MSVWVGQDWDKDHGKGCILASISPADGLQDATSGCPLWLINEMKSWTCPASSQPVPSPPGICTLPSGLPNHRIPARLARGWSCHADTLAPVANGWQEE